MTTVEELAARVAALEACHESNVAFVQAILQHLHELDAAVWGSASADKRARLAAPDGATP
jgi:hypothetical protein